MSSLFPKTTTAKHKAKEHVAKPELYSLSIVLFLGIFLFSFPHLSSFSTKWQGAHLWSLLGAGIFFLLSIPLSFLRGVPTLQGRPLTWHLGHFALHGFFGFSLLSLQHQDLLWLFLVLSWLLYGAFYGAFLRAHLHRLQSLIAPVVILLCLLVLSNHDAQKLFFGIGCLLIEITLAAGLWRTHQDKMLQEHQRLLSQIQIYEAWQTKIQHHIEQETSGRMFLDQHEANNLLCGLVLHANVAEASLLSQNNRAVTSSKDFLQNIRDLVESSRELQTLFTKQESLSFPKKLPPPQTGTQQDLIKAFEQASLALQSRYPEVCFHNQAKYAGHVLCPKSDFSLKDFFSLMLQELIQNQQQGEITLSTSLLDHLEHKTLRVLLKYQPKLSHENLFGELVTQQVPPALSLIRLYLDLCGGVLLESNLSEETTSFLLEFPYDPSLPTATHCEVAEDVAVLAPNQLPSPYPSYTQHTTR
ncbi:MAG: hypothetical protein H6728_10520 [Myxococcales bacterium]|nr:hypothetical protein [Myxococcales bacterium]